MNGTGKVATCAGCEFIGTTDCPECFTHDRRISRFEDTCIYILALLLGLPMLLLLLIIICIDALVDVLAKIV